MKQYESEHYVFNFNTDSVAEKNILHIAKKQELCLSYICNVLQVSPNFKIKYFLCDSPEEVGEIYGDNDPCNGFAEAPDKVYAVYNDKVRCIGFHEDAHLISYLIAANESPAIREGLAMFFDRQWWGIHNMEWTCYYLLTDRYQSISKMLDKDAFYEIDDFISYPIVGSFTEWLISSFGINNYIEFYKTTGSTDAAFKLVYGKTAEELNDSFASYIRMFGIDKAVKERMEALLTEEY